MRPSIFTKPNLATAHPFLSTNELTGKVIGAAIKVHRRLGPGLLESAYEACLAHELHGSGLGVVRQKAVPVVYDSVKLECGFRADLVVENRIVVELKCKEEVHPVDYAQLLSHLRLLDLRVGLLINFHVTVLKSGITRIVNDYREEEHIAETLRTAAECAEKTEI
jgi:GxxExxY protein